MRDALGRIGRQPVLYGRYAAHRIARGVVQRRLRATYRRRVTSAPPVGLRVPTIGLAPLDELPTPLGGSANRILAEADSILTHQVDYLGSGPVALGARIDWHADFVSGYRWPAEYYADVEVTRLEDDSDAKVPWELSRGHQLLTLARAAVIAEDERYSNELASQLASWLDANPPGYGISWVTAMEVGIRSVNWIWAIGTLEQWRPLDRALRADVAASLQAHARHTALNLEESPLLRSNHFLANVLGLAAAAFALPDDPHAGRWGRFARHALERETQIQLLPDGVSFEASLSYHGLVLELLALTRLLLTWSGARPSPAVDGRLSAMVDVVRAVRHPNGRIPLFGDGDSGRVLPEGFERPPSHDPIVWTTAAIVGGPRPLTGEVPAEVAWTLGVDAWSSMATRPLGPAPPAHFPEGGIAVLKRGDAHLVARCGGVGQRGVGGHAHNDLLSYELSVETPVVVDSGTYCYTSDVAARNAFRSARAHNVPVVDGAEPNPIDPSNVFSLPGRAKPWLGRPVERNGVVALKAGHDYGPLKPPARVERTFELGGDALVVLDRIDGEGVRTIESFVHLAAGLQVEPLTATAQRVVGGPREIVIEFDGVDSADVARGFVSDRYGVRTEANVLRAVVRTGLPAELSYRIAFHPMAADG
jgi:hypothetical protein